MLYGIFDYNRPTSANPPSETSSSVSPCTKKR
jgi:hypothetical protein